MVRFYDFTPYGNPVDQIVQIKHFDINSRVGCWQCVFYNKIVLTHCFWRLGITGIFWERKKASTSGVWHLFLILLDSVKYLHRTRLAVQTFSINKYKLVKFGEGGGVKLKGHLLNLTLEPKRGYILKMESFYMDWQSSNCENFLKI